MPFILVLNKDPFASRTVLSLYWLLLLILSCTVFSSHLFQHINANELHWSKPRLANSKPVGYKTFNNNLRTSILSVKKIYKGVQLIKQTKTDIIMLLMQATNIPRGGE